MKVLIFVLVGAVTCVAQPIPAGMKVGLSMYLQAGYDGLKSELSEAADMMPESDYGFRPGAAPEMRTFGQIFAHVAESQFGTCASLRSVPNPVAGKNLEKDLKTKAEFVKALAESFALCDRCLGPSLTRTRLNTSRSAKVKSSRAPCLQASWPTTAKCTESPRYTCGRGT